MLLLSAAGAFGSSSEAGAPAAKGAEALGGTARRPRLEAEIAYLAAPLTLSREQNFALAPDARERVLILEMSGVPLRSCRIEEIRLDRRLRALARRGDPRNPLAGPYRLRAKSGSHPPEPPPMAFDSLGVPLEPDAPLPDA